MSNFLRKETEIASDRAVQTGAAPVVDSAIHTLEAGTDSNPLITSVAAPPASAGTAVAAARAQEEERVALFTPNEANELRSRWGSVQVGFVDEPRKAVEEADALVAATMERLTAMFAVERQKLEEQWDRSADVSTEDFRLALRRYRSFFTRLLTI